jgi:menaquinone-specific isochorismate synthase
LCFSDDMPVTQYSHQILATERELYQFLTYCQHRLNEKNPVQIVSFSLEIAAIDPLAAFYQDCHYQPSNFYFEKQSNFHSTGFHLPRPNSTFPSAASLESSQTAIAAIGSTAEFCCHGKDRFTKAKAWIQETLAKTILVGDLSLPSSGAHFFCSFSFTDSVAHCPTLNQAGTGFSPATVVLPQWQLSYSHQRSVVVANLMIRPETKLDVMVDDFWRQLQEWRSIPDELLRPILPQPLLSQLDYRQQRPVASTDQFKQAVMAVLGSIHAGLFHKIVLAHAVDVMSPIAFHPVHSLHYLRSRYPDCLVFATGNAQQQYFIGASPERLVSLAGGRLVTDALAGSAARGRTAYEDAGLANTLLHSHKELHEHRVVVEFITRQLEALGLMVQQSPLRLLQLSNIQHLHTPIRADVPTTTHLLDIVAALHPTPAVAGMPRDIACEHIQRYEPFGRSLYAAPIGWVNHRGEGEFAVGIRSALLEGNRARLFGGAGIVAGSDPDKELAEVQLKMQALLAALV